MFDVVANGIFNGPGNLAHRINGIPSGVFSLAIQTSNAVVGLLQSAVSLCLGVASDALFYTFPEILSSFTQPIFVHSHSPVSGLVAPPLDVDKLMLAGSNPDQNSDAYGHRKSDEGAVFDFRDNPVQGIRANPVADLDCLIAETRCLLTCQASDTPVSLNHFAQNRSDCLADLIAGSRYVGMPAGFSSETLKLFLDGP